ncbi:MAG: hypothetical protein LBI95_02245 [Holosporales bacterium]|jgi:hypothetical protein|nr:hypothetical protein [Holosporales bacterium]
MNIKEIITLFLLLPCGVFGSSTEESSEENFASNSSFREIVNFSSLSSSTDLPNAKDFDDGIASLKRISTFIKKPEKVPRNLRLLNKTFKKLVKRMKTSNRPDDIDIIFLLDANGKTQTITIMKFLAEIENKLSISAKKNLPDVNLKLFATIDSFVAAGSAAIPAAIAALGRLSQEEAIGYVSTIPIKMIFPKSLDECCSCCRCFRSFGKSVISAYFDKPEIINEESPDWCSLIYDAFNFHKGGGLGLLKLFEGSSIEDLRTSLEVLSLSNGRVISEIVSGAISARDKDAKSNVKRVIVSEILSSAEDALAIKSKIDEKKPSLEAPESAVDKLKNMKVVLNTPKNNTSGTLLELREILMRRSNIPRDMLVVNILADTFRGDVFVPSFSYEVKRTKNKKKIINMNYRFAIPHYLYTPAQDQIDTFRSAINSGVKSIFPGKFDHKTNISTATKMLINFLNACNFRVLEEFEKKERE